MQPMNIIITGELGFPKTATVRFVSGSSGQRRSHENPMRLVRSPTNFASRFRNAKSLD